MSKQIKISKEQRKEGFLNGFKNFIMRGNVIDMAVGVIVGGAFGKIVTSLVNDIQNALEEKERELDEVNRKLNDYESSPDPADKLKTLCETAPQIFTRLEACSVGYMSGSEGEYLLLTAAVTEPMSDAEIETLKNWLRTETGLDRVKVYIG